MLLIKQSMKKQKLKNRRRLSLPTRLVLLAVLILSFGILLPRVYANQLLNQINDLQNQNSQTRQKLSALDVEAANLQEVINALQDQIAGLQAQISANQAKNEELKKQIAAAEEELAKQKKLLGENIKAMYLEGKISTIEILATSKDLSEFVDREQYRNAVKDKIKNTVDKITELKLQLKAQKDEVERLITEQQALQSQIAMQKAEQDRLLNLNQSQQNEYNQQIKNNQGRIAELKRQYVLENIRLFGGGIQPGIPGGGGYPWGNAYCRWTGNVGGSCPNYDWYFNGRAWDPWGYGYRNCTSWVAYKLSVDGKRGFNYLGDANEWPGRAKARGLSVEYGQGARVGDAAVSMRGYYGHVMYVEAVLSDGRVVVSDYNRGGDGLYRGPDGGNANVLSQGSLAFIHF